MGCRHMCVDWQDGTTSWERLIYLKECNPIEVAGYSISHDIQYESMCFVVGNRFLAGGPVLSTNFKYGLDL
jgi:hypothetical protein